MASISWFDPRPRLLHRVIHPGRLGGDRDTGLYHLIPLLRVGRQMLAGQADQPRTVDSLPKKQRSQNG